ncbi:MAG: NAD(P)-dependent alcohol dehydrogenase [bacterium]
MPNKMRAAFLYGPKDLRVERIDIPKVRDDEVLVRVEANGICGSDVHFFLEGKLGPFVVDRPYIPGHESSGIVVELGKKVRGLRTGDRVVIEPGIACRRCELCKRGRYNLCPDVVFLSAPPVNGTFAEFVAVPSDFVFKIPDSMDIIQGSMIEPTAVGVHAANRAGIQAGMSVAVLGVGPIGLLTLQCARAYGAADVFAVDVVEHRLNLAEELGATQTIDASRVDPVRAILDATGGRGADVVLETAGNVETTRQTVDVAKRGGVVVQVGWPGLSEVPYKLEIIMEKELDVRGINRYANAYPRAIELVSAGRVKVSPLITHKFELDSVKEAFEFVAAKRDNVIKAVVTP